MGESVQKRALLINMSPDRCRQFLKGEAMMEVVLLEPKALMKSTPFKVYICCAKNTPKGEQQLVISDDIKSFPAAGKVVAECVCDEMFPVRVFPDNGAIQDWNFHNLVRTGYDYDVLSEKLMKSKTHVGYVLSLMSLKQYVMPRDIYALGCRNLPHGWCYATERNWDRYVRKECDQDG